MRAFVCLVLLALPLGAMEEPLPQAAPAGRYQQSLAQSPFALATKAEAPAAPQDSFAANWVLTGISRMPDDRGVMQDFVTVRSRDQHMAFSLFGPESSGDKEATGVTIEKVERAEESRRSFVMLRKGAEVAKVEFSQEALVPAAPVPPAGQPGTGRPSFPPIGGNNIPGGNAGNPPGGLVRPALPRPLAGPPVSGGGAGTVAGNAGAGAPGATGHPAGPDHRRVRVISSQTQ